MNIFEESKVPPILEPTENDIVLMLAAKCHLGTKNVSNRMKPYVFSRRADGIQIIHLGKTWEKLILAARVLVTVKLEDIYVTFSTAKTRRPAIKLTQYIGGKTNQNKFVPGTFTNTLEEPSTLVCMDPMTDFQAVQESSKCNIPVIAFTNTHCSLKYVDLAIPCNNLGVQSLGLMCWFLSRAILRLRGTLSYTVPWDVLPDMFFYSDIEEENEDEHQPAHPYEPMQKQGNWDATAFSAVEKDGFQYGSQDTPDNWNQNIFSSQDIGNWANEVPQDQKHQFESQEVSLTDWAEDMPETQEQKQEPEEEGWGGDTTSAASKPFVPSKTPWDD